MKPFYTKIYGISFYKENLQGIKVGDELELINVKNDYDANAIGIFKDKKQLGWISAKFNRV